jgi:hypothetical protein
MLRDDTYHKAQYIASVITTNGELHDIRDKNVDWKKNTEYTSVITPDLF